MIILAYVRGIQTGAILRYRRRKKSDDSQNLMSFEITMKVNVLIVTQYFETSNQFPETQ